MKKPLYLFISLFITASVNAQVSDEIQIKTIVETFFKGMRTSDSSLVRVTVMDGARLETITKDKYGKTTVKSDKIDGFIKAIGTPHKEVWDERITSIDIKIDAELATVWTPYHFYLDQKLLHCGANAFQFVKIDNIWKIYSIIDTRRKEKCK